MATTVQGTAQGRSRGQEMARLMKGALFWAVFVLALPLHAALSQEPGPDHHKSETESANYPVEQREHQIPVVPLAVLASVQATLNETVRTIKQQAVTAEKQAQATKETWCSPSVLVNIVLALIGFGYLRYMSLQSRSMEKSLRITHRAILGIKIIEFKLGHQLAADVHFVNYGQLGARNVQPQITDYVDTDPPERTNYLAVKLPPAVAQTLAELMPSVVAIQPLDQNTIQLSDQQLDDILNGRSYVYVVGRIGYHDGFEENEVPLFCYWLDVKRNMMRPAWRPANRGMG